MVNQGTDVVGAVAVVRDVAVCREASVRFRLWTTETARVADNLVRGPRARRNKRRERVVQTSDQQRIRREEESHHLVHQRTGEAEDEM
jgi:hypothetical protein